LHVNARRGAKLKIIQPLGMLFDISCRPEDGKYVHRDVKKNREVR
jgi:hypothetical protein